MDDGWALYEAITRVEPPTVPRRKKRARTRRKAKPVKAARRSRAGCYCRHPRIFENSHRALCANCGSFIEWDRPAGGA